MTASALRQARSLLSNPDLIQILSSGQGGKPGSTIVTVEVKRRQAVRRVGSHHQQWRDENAPRRAWPPSTPSNNSRLGG
jgi:hypothetical protein